MDTTRNDILRKYQISPDAWLSGGMESEVYAYGVDTVLKLYTGTARLAELLTLQDFYDSLDRQLVPYALPRIHEVIQEDGFIAIVEQRLTGIALSEVLPMLTPSQLDTSMHRYLTAALELARIHVPSTWDRYKLFDPGRISDRSKGDWHQFLSRYLTDKLMQINPYLSRDVPQFAQKMQRLRTVLDPPYGGTHRLVHGDFCPGNLLIDDTFQITALLDFGLLTMYGDPLFDLATGWVFFDMYDELNVQVRSRYLAMLLDRLGKRVRGKLYHYVLIYSILSANTYSSTCTDGHYQWCVANLCNQDYWNEIE